MAGWSPPWRVCVREFNSTSCTCTRAHTVEEPRRWEARGDAAHARTPTRGVTGKGGLVGETTGSATPRSWQLFPRWADRSAGRIQPSRAPSIMAPFSSFPYLRQHGWHGFLSLLGPILRHEQRRAVYPSLWTEWRQSYIPSSGDVASHGVIADTRPAVDRNPAARGAAIATQTVTPICYSIHYATPGLRNCARAQYVSFDIWQGQQGFRLLPEHLDFPTAPLLHARAIINSTWSMTWSMARVHCPFANIRIICLISFFYDFSCETRYE